MEGPDEVYMRKDRSTLETSSEVLQVKDGVSVRGCDAVECPVISARSPVSRRLLGAPNFLIQGFESY